MSALMSHRVAVTRDEAPDGELARALREAGLRPVHCPAVVTLPPRDPKPLARAAGELEAYDWLIASSARAVAAVVQARGGRCWPPSLRTAAVGRRTALTLEAAGAREVMTAREAGAQALASRLREAGAWSGRRILLPRAEDGRTDIADTLRALGGSVDEVVAYRTVGRTASQIRAEWTAARPDAAIVVSPSAAIALTDAVGAGALNALVAVVAIGATTRTALATLGVNAEVSRDAELASVAARMRELLTDRAPRQGVFTGAGGHAGPVSGVTDGTFTAMHRLPPARREVRRRLAALVSGYRRER